MNDTIGVALVIAVLMFILQIALIMAIFNISKQTTKTANLIQEWLDLEYPEVDENPAADKNHKDTTRVK